MGTLCHLAPSPGVRKVTPGRMRASLGKRGATRLGVSIEDTEVVPRHGLHG